MSVSRKVLRKMKKVMGVISTIPVLASCSSQISHAVDVDFEPSTGKLHFSGDGGVVIDSSWKDRYSPESIKCVVIDDGFKIIDEAAFCACKSLEKINIPNSVTSIDEAAFCGCDSLKEINIPNSVTSIGKAAFRGCKSLEKINIPESVTSIDEAAFYFCESLQEINIPNSVTSIGEMAFSGCESLEKINIPKSVTSIAREVFSCCESLKEVTIPNSVTIIGNRAFSCCNSLKEVTIPNSVQIIDYGAFLNSGLERVKFEDMSRCNSKSCWAVLLCECAFGGCKQLGILDFGNNTNIFRISNDGNMSRIAKVERHAFWKCDPNFVTLEGRTVRGKFYSTVLS